MKKEESERLKAILFEMADQIDEISLGLPTKWLEVMHDSINKFDK